MAHPPTGANAGAPRISCRLVGPGDRDSLFGLLHDLGYADLDRDRFEQTYAAVLAHPEIRVFVAHDESGLVLGMLSLSSRPQLRLGGTLVSIDELVVAQHARGRGIGRLLLAEAIHYARALGAKRLELHTNRARESYRRRFYEINGFTEANSAVMRFDLAERV